MKHLFLYLLLAINLITVSLKAQDYQISFTNESGQQPDSIQITNLTSNEVMMLKGNEILHLTTSPTGVEQGLSISLPLSIQPNPMQQNTRLMFYNSQAGKVSITALNMAGQILARYNGNLP